jgi:hypothetical protein
MDAQLRDDPRPSWGKNWYQKDIASILEPRRPTKHSHYMHERSQSGLKPTNAIGHSPGPTENHINEIRTHKSRLPHPAVYENHEDPKKTRTTCLDLDEIQI